MNQDLYRFIKMAVLKLYSIDPSQTRAVFNSSHEQYYDGFNKTVSSTILL